MGLSADAKQIIAELDVEINNIARQVAQELVEQSVLTAENIIREAIEEKNSQNEVVEAFDFDQYSYL
jgi:flagellar biosynthesis/type III secretory pathway protein FliH